MSFTGSLQIGKVAIEVIEAVISSGHGNTSSEITNALYAGCVITARIANRLVERKSTTVAARHLTTKTDWHVSDAFT